jgi:hypothetical protein
MGAMGETGEIVMETAGVWEKKYDIDLVSLLKMEDTNVLLLLIPN